jgi:phospholipase C
VRRRTVLLPLIAATAAGGLALTGSPAATAGVHRDPGPRVVGPYSHLVVIYQENHSFDNLYGNWGKVGGQRVDGLQTAPRSRTVQRAQDGTPYRCLLQNDVNLTSPTPLPTTCTDPTHGVLASAFRNSPWRVDDYIRPQDTTCPPPDVFAPNGVLKGQGQPGGCTRDLVHRFYQEQYQLDDGRQDQYVTGSDAVGLTMGYYDTKQLPIYRYLHSKGGPHYVLADRFFQAAFGGSFLNHQYLVAARAPVDTDPTVGGTTDLHSLVDANGMPVKYPLYNPTGPVKDAQLTQACNLPTTNPRFACGDYAVNTMQPAQQPAGGGAVLPLIDASKYPTIGDRLMAAKVSWNWYSGGWNAVQADPKSAPLFQFHHQPLNYFSSFAPGTEGRTHLRDETEFIAAAKNGTLPTVSFVKPYGAENEHPGYASEPNGSDHLVDLLKAVTTGPQAKDTLVVVTYDEFGGQWDHVSPPGQGTRGVHDLFGPGTRIPALLVSAGMTRSGVDHTVYDTTSILATIERGLGLVPLSTRDARVNDLWPAVWKGGAVTRR